jgi:hypothetical protein
MSRRWDNARPREGVRAGAAAQSDEWLPRALGEASLVRAVAERRRELMSKRPTVARPDYIFGAIPKALARGRILVHNHVYPVAGRSGVRGSRIWLFQRARRDAEEEANSGGNSAKNSPRKHAATGKKTGPKGRVACAYRGSRPHSASTGNAWHKSIWLAGAGCGIRRCARPCVRRARRRVGGMRSSSIAPRQDRAPTSLVSPWTRFDEDCRRLSD